MPPTDTDDNPWWVTDDPSDWVESDTDGVYFRDSGDATGMSGYSPTAAARNGRAIRETFGDDVVVVITAGPYRMYDIKFEADPETRRVRLDYYSVRAGTHRIDEVIDDLRGGEFDRAAPSA